RHTRCLSDWSSDVCSSDLTPQLFLEATRAGEEDPRVEYLQKGRKVDVRVADDDVLLGDDPDERAIRGDNRYTRHVVVDHQPGHQIGRASCREVVEIAGGEG